MEESEQANAYACILYEREKKLAKFVTMLFHTKGRDT